ncbi:phage tail protein [Temperatibacter marinus]|uniref:Phage tail protein n=1 Tax=Temperatibacter marinus TaxID=1456591 RepID=A0AA52H8F0_9PROT|nr:phage tail protein [Temperatibacter marinus]WND02061.1 phage tail protein [Temperatibacter marinus]
MGLLSTLFRVFFSGPKQDRTVGIDTSGATAGLKIVYGTVKMTPITVYKCVSRDHMPVQSGKYDQELLPLSRAYEERRPYSDWLYKVDVWGLGPLTSIEQLWVDGEDSRSRKFTRRPYIRAHSQLGRPRQKAIVELSRVEGSQWTTQHRGFDICYSVHRFYASKNKPLFRAEPSTEALVKGRAVYDPRQRDQLASDPSTWAYSENSILIALDYLMAEYGIGANAEEIDWESWKQAATYCDATLLDIPDVMRHEEVQPGRIFDDRYNEWMEINQGDRYPDYRPKQTAGIRTLRRHEAHIALDPKRPAVENMRLLLEGLAWSMPWSNGKHKIILEHSVTQNDVVAHFDGHDIMGDVKISYGGLKDRYNQVTIEFLNANKNYEADAVSWPPFSKASNSIYQGYLAEDQNQKLHSRRKVEAISDFYQAQAFAEFLVRKSRVKTSIRSLPLSPRAILLEPGDVISLSLPNYTEATALFRVENIAFGHGLDPVVDLHLYEASVYGVTSEQEPYSPKVGKEWEIPESVDDLSAAAFKERNSDGTALFGFDLTWTTPSLTSGIDFIEIAWRAHRTGQAPEAEEEAYTETLVIPKEVSTAKIKGLKDNRSYDIRVSYRTALGQVSEISFLTAALPDYPTTVIAADTESVAGREAGDVDNDAQIGRELSEHNTTKLDPSSVEGLDIDVRTLQASGGELIVSAQDSLHEGGQIKLKGASVFPDYYVDNYLGHCRVVWPSENKEIFRFHVGGGFWFSNKKAFETYDQWLRINSTSGFSSGIYTGTSLIRTDNMIQVGSWGAAFSVNKYGSGFFAKEVTVVEEVKAGEAYQLSLDTRPEDVTPLTNGLALTLRLAGYQKTEAAVIGLPSYGFDYSEVRAIAPNLCMRDSRGRHYIAYPKVTVLNTEAIKSLHSSYQDLLRRVSILEERLSHRPYT